MNRAMLMAVGVFAFLHASLAHATAEPSAPQPAAPAQAAKPALAFRPYARPVTTWVPPYAVAKACAGLASQPAVAESLTHLGLQFWRPTKAGGVELVKDMEANEARVAELRDWGHANGVRVMLCVYNAVGGKWDWPLARAAFADHGEAFARNLVAEVERLGLDGVDMDLEGNGDLDADKAAFITFMTDLSTQLRAKGKHLTVDTFCHKWNAPNATWWLELFPLVDALATMGYEEIGASAGEWRAYAAQRDAAKEHANKLQIGMPGSRDAWRGNSALEQIKWVRDDGRCGVAIWDAQLRGAAWRAPEVWTLLREIRSGEKK